MRNLVGMQMGTTADKDISLWVVILGEIFDNNRMASVLIFRKTHLPVLNLFQIELKGGSPLSNLLDHSLPHPTALFQHIVIDETDLLIHGQFIF